MSATRREFVAMMLGARFALGCRSGAPSLPPGELIDTGMVRAHAAVRDGHSIEVAPTRRCRVAIVGAGIAGLAAAWELRRRGVRDVIVFELAGAIGGTARGGRSPATAYPWGAHYIVAPQREQDDLIALLGEMGAIEDRTTDGTPIIDEALRCREPEERVWHLGRWWEGLYLEAGATADDRAQLAAFRRAVDAWVGWRDTSGRRAFAIPRARASDDPEVVALDRLSFAAWLDERRLTSPRLRWLCDYACRDDYALTAATTSAWAGLFYFAGRQARPGADAQTVITWPDGNHALVDHLAHGQVIERDVAVIEVSDTGPGARVTARTDAGAFAIDADAAIVATPSFVANRLVRGRSAPIGSDYGAWAVANVHLRARPREHGRGAPPAWDNVFRDSPSLGYVSATHQRGRDRGATVWTWYYPFTDEHPAAVREKLAGASYPEWAETVLADLGRAHPDIRDHVERIEVAFWGHGMIRPRTGTLFGPSRAAPLGHVHFAHTDLSGYALFEEAFDHGLRAARAVVEALST